MLIRITKVIHIADEKCRWAFNLISGGCRCSSCSGSASKWNSHPYAGKALSLEDRSVLFDCLRQDLDLLLKKAEDPDFAKALKKTKTEKDLPQFEHLLQSAREDCEPGSYLEALHLCFSRDELVAEIGHSSKHLSPSNIDLFLFSYLFDSRT